MIFRHKGMICFLSLAPAKLLTSDPVVVEKELTMTKKIVDILRMILAIANCVVPRCSMRIKKRNQGATLIKECIMLQAEKLSHESFVKNGKEAVMLFVYFETSIADQHE